MLAQVVNRHTAGIVLEPVLGEGGIIPLNIEFVRQARELATRYGALLVTDETQCGLGRTGRYFGYQWSSIRPDIVVAAKPLAVGLPLGATLFTERAAQALPVNMHGTTFGGGPLACRVAIEFLALLDQLLPSVRETGDQLLAGLRRLQTRHPVITGIRGKVSCSEFNYPVPATRSCCALWNVDCFLIARTTQCSGFYRHLFCRATRPAT